MDADSGFGAWVRARRRALGLSREELAQACAYSVSLLQKVELGARRPSRELAARLAAVLGEPPRTRASGHPAALAALPAPTSRIVGREADLANIQDALTAAGIRLLTLTGPPGVGKTRVANEVARALAPSFEGGAIYVPLAPVQDPEVVPVAIAQVLSLSGVDSRPIAQQVVDALRHRHALLVLDNFEHVLDAASLVSTLLAAGPRLCVLATSRVALRLAGEHAYPVRPLATPPAPEAGHPDAMSGRTSPQQLAAYPALAVFVQVARAVGPEFTLSEANTGPVAELCRRLDGLPLAIELAAAQTRLRSPRELLQQLAAHRVARWRGPRDAPERQQTLWHAIDWSYHLLTRPQQMLLRRMGVFVGGCDLTAAAAVSALEESAALDLLDTLVGHSLVQARSTEDGETRYTLLETVREYALEQLDAAGDAQAARDGHVQHYAALALALEEDARWGARQAAALSRLDREISNLRALLEWSLDDRQPGERAARLAVGLHTAGAIWAYWLWRGSLLEGESWMGRLLRDGDEAAPEALARALRGAAGLAMFIDPQRAVAYSERSRAICQALGDESGGAQALHYLARSLRNYGQAARSEEASRAALAAMRVQGVVGDQAWVLLNLADCASDRRDFAAAEGFARQALALSRQVGDPLGAGYALTILGRIAQASERPREAVALLEEALAVMSSREVPGGPQGVMESLGYALYLSGDLERSEAIFRDSLRYWWERGSSFHLPSRLEGLAAVAAARGDGVRAARLLGVAEALREELGFALALDYRGNEYMHVVDRVRGALDPETFRSAWEDGRTAPLDDAVVSALGAAAPAGPGAARQLSAT